MSDYIVDASVVVQYLITDTYTSNARALFLSLSENDKIHVPEFCLLECANVLWKQVRFNGMTPSDADILVSELILLPLNVANLSNVLNRALEIGLQYQLAVYDSAYIALAEKLAYPFITVDARQEQAARVVGITLKPVTDFK
jgi:predicted nucleic acid-binding protein